MLGAAFLCGKQPECRGFALIADLRLGLYGVVAFGIDDASGNGGLPRSLCQLRGFAFVSPRTDGLHWVGKVGKRGRDGKHAVIAAPAKSRDDLLANPILKLHRAGQV